MAAIPAVQWAFSIVFLALAGHGGYRFVVDRTQRSWAFAHLAHTAMALDMAAMPWPWWSSVPSGVRVLVFGAVTIVLVALVVIRLPRMLRGELSGSHELRHLGGLAVMTSVMLWMVLAMRDGLAGAHPDGHGDHGLSGPLASIGNASVIALLVLGAVFLLDALRCDCDPGGEHRRRAGDAVSAGIMSLTMAVSSLIMLHGG